MALPSQSGFSSHRRGNMYRRRRRRRGTSWLIMFVVAAAITWFVWPDQTDQDGPETRDADPSDAIVDGSEAESFPVPPRIAQETTPDEVIAKDDPIISTPELPIEVTQEDSTQINTEEVASLIENALNTTPDSTPLAGTISSNLASALVLLENDQIVAARSSLSSTLRNGSLTNSEVAQARGLLRDLSDKLVFSREIFANDQYAIDYVVKSGDTLSGIVQKMGLQVNWRFIQRINGIRNASSIRYGQNLKLITGPFHAIIHKAHHRIDVYLGEGAEQVFVRSFRIGLGEFNSTPTGMFRVRKDSKLINPTWSNPRTGEFYGADNPQNPIGERWIGLEGIDELTKDLSGLGIHGTIAPETIGKDASMGCIRMLEDDVAIVYELLAESVSTVEIR